MNKNQFKKLLDKIIQAENEVSQLVEEHHINYKDAPKENFYNLYNYVIFKFIGVLYGEYGRELIESFLFENTDMTFDELCEKLEIYE